MSPQVIVGCIQTLWGADILHDIQANYLFYVVYFINQLLPFIIIGSLPETHKRLGRWIEHMKRFLGYRTPIYPLMTTVAAGDRVTNGTIY